MDNKRTGFGYMRFLADMGVSPRFIEWLRKSTEDQRQTDERRTQEMRQAGLGYYQYVYHCRVR